MSASSRKGKTALVTGSTSGIGLGIGLGIATRLAAEGANIMLNGFGAAAEVERLRAQLAAAHAVSVIYDGADMTNHLVGGGLRFVSLALMWPPRVSGTIVGVPDPTLAAARHLLSGARQLSP